MANLAQQRNCFHFGACGGCSAQNMEAANYKNWKINHVVEALERERLEIEISNYIACAPQSRRRAVFGFSKQTGKAILGFHEARSHRIVPVTECLVAKPVIVKALPVLRSLAGIFQPVKTSAGLTVLATDNGLDVSVVNVEEANPAQRQAAIGAASNTNITRLAVNGEIIAQFALPFIQMGPARVTPPPGSFVQAVAEAEEALANIVVDAIKKIKAKSVTDLFAGCGAFTFRLAESCRVHAVEHDALALAALEKASRETSRLKPITREKRDLFRQPLLSHELKSSDAVILDPPRQGARAQITEIAKAKPPLIVYISCSPPTFARDAKMLTEAGFLVESLTLVDQFLWSEHIELVAVLKQPTPHRRA